MNNPVRPPPVTIKLPVTAYILAVVSALFVTFGVILVTAFSTEFLGNWSALLPHPVLALIPHAVALGILSGWQSLRQARRKAEAASQATQRGKA